MIIQLSSTLSILSLIRRHVQKQFAHITRPIIAKNHTSAIITGTYAEFIRHRGGRPAQLFGVGREVVDLDRPRELYECVSPHDEFLRGEYDHYVSFLMKPATSTPALNSRIIKPSTFTPL